jgi:hypothetical protein
MVMEKHSAVCLMRHLFIVLILVLGGHGDCMEATGMYGKWAYGRGSLG